MTTSQDLERIRQFLSGQMSTPEGGTPIIDQPDEYDGFADSGTGQRGYLDFKYMPAPMDASTYTPAPQAVSAYMPPPQAASANTAYRPLRRVPPINTAYMPPRQVASAYIPPRQTAPINATPTPTPSYGVTPTPSYGVTTAPSYGNQPSYSPKQAGKYNVDGTRLRNTGGLFNDLNAFFGRPQT